MRGNAVILRPIRKTDLHILNVWKNDEEIYMYLGGGYNPVSEDQQEKWMDSLIDMTGNSRRFMILDTNEVPIGMVGLYEINWIHRTCELGIYIADRNVRGKGCATEAASLVLNFASEYLNLRKAKSKVVSDNIASIKMLFKLGFTIVGEYKKERFIKGHYLDLTIMEKFLQTDCLVEDDK